MDIEIFLGLMFLLFWLLCEVICIWMILKDFSEEKCLPPVYGCPENDTPTRQSSKNKPNFYS